MGPSVSRGAFAEALVEALHIRGIVPCSNVTFSYRVFNPRLSISVSVEIRLEILNQRTFIPHILQHRQCMPGASATTREMCHQGLEWNVSQNLNRPIEKLVCSLAFCRLEQFFHVAEEKKSLGAKSGE
jgi:hypothetical protein